MPISAPQFLNRKIMESFSPGEGFSFTGLSDLNIATDWDLSDLYQKAEDEEQRQNPAPTSGVLAGGYLEDLKGIIEDMSNRQAAQLRQLLPELTESRIKEAQVFQKLGIESIETAYKNKYMYDTLPKYAIAAAVAPNMFLKDVVGAPLAHTGGHRAAAIGLTAGATNEPRVQI